MMRKRKKGQRFVPIPLFVCRRIAERERSKVDSRFRHDYHSRCIEVILRMCTPGPCGMEVRWISQKSLFWV